MKSNALNLHKKYEKWQNIFWQDYNINPIRKRISRKKERRLAVKQWFSLLFNKDHNICGKYKGSVVIAYALHAPKLPNCSFHSHRMMFEASFAPQKH